MFVVLTRCIYFYVIICFPLEVTHLFMVVFIIDAGAGKVEACHFDW